MVSLRILPYDEVDPDDVVWLNRIGLWYDIAARDLRKVRRIDPRLPEEFAWYAVVDRRPVSQVSYLRYPVRTIEGPETVGVPAAVCTLPEAARRGYARALMEHVHERLRAEGARFSFLCTSRFRGAYNLYRSLGYEDATPIRVAFGRLPAVHARDMKLRRAEGHDRARFRRIFSAHVRDAVGFVERPKDFVSIRTAWRDVRPEEMWTLLSKGRVTGYAWCARGTHTHIRELVAEKGDPIAWASVLGGKHDVSLVLSPRALAAPYESAGLRVTDSWGVLMVKDLTTRRTQSEVRHLFGIDSRRFEALSFDLW